MRTTGSRSCGGASAQYSGYMGITIWPWRCASRAAGWSCSGSTSWNEWRSHATVDLGDDFSPAVGNYGLGPSFCPYSLSCRVVGVLTLSRGLRPVREADARITSVPELRARARIALSSAPTGLLPAEAAVRLPRLSSTLPCESHFRRVGRGISACGLH